MHNLPRVLTVFLVLLGILLLSIIVRTIFAAELAQTWPGDLHSKLEADYSADPDALQIAQLDPAIIAEAFADAQTSGGAPTPQPGSHLPTIIAWLEAPVPRATPRPGEKIPSTQQPPRPTPTLPPTQTPMPTQTPLPTAIPTFEPTPTPTYSLAPSVTPVPTTTPTPRPTKPPSSNPSPTWAATATLVSTPNLSYSAKTASGTEFFPSDVVSYQVSVKNDSALTATDIKVLDTLPVTFTLNTASTYGPASVISGQAIQWGPFDVPAFSEVHMGFEGTLDYEPNPPMGSRGVQIRNQAEISAPWLSPPLYRSVDVLVLYPPVVEVIANSLTPTTAIQNQVVNFEVAVSNRGSAWANLDTTSYLELVDNNAVVFTAPLASEKLLPADASTQTLIFEPIVLSSAPPGPFYASLHLHWLDENGINDGVDFSDIGQVIVNSGPALRAEPTPPSSTTLTAGSTQVFRFYVWNDGLGTGELQLFSDYVEIYGSRAWGPFFPLSSFNFYMPNPTCTGTDVWSGVVASSPTDQKAKWTMTAEICGNPYLWEPDPVPNPPVSDYYAYFDLQTTAPITPGTYTLTLKTSLNQGTILTEEFFSYNIP